MQIRTTKPGAGNKYYIRAANGGYSPCIKGKPTDKDCNVLANCVGYAVGRFNEASNEGKIKFLASMDAENFFANAHKWGLKTGQEPKQGAIMCWSKGKAGVSSDGAGHVAFVEKANSLTQVYTSESGYNSSAFWNSTRNKGSNGNWGASSSYKFLGFIYNPNTKEDPKPAPTPTPTPKPVDNPLKVGDKVQITGKGNGSSCGTANIAGGIGWTRYITKIYIGRSYPYQVGNKGKTDSKNTTGFYRASALRRL